MSKSLFRTVTAAMLCALVFVFTFLSVPAGVGHVNLGDGALLLAAWSLGGPWAVIAAAGGAALADLAGGYALYAPATFVIKALMVLSVLLVQRLLCRLHLSVRLCRLLSAVIAEGVMVLGYFIYEAWVLGYGLGAAASIPFNAVQGAVAVALSGALFELLCRAGILTREGKISFLQ